MYVTKRNINNIHLSCDRPFYYTDTRWHITCSDRRLWSPGIVLHLRAIGDAQIAVYLTFQFWVIIAVSVKVMSFHSTAIWNWEKTIRLLAKKIKYKNKFYEIKEKLGEPLYSVFQKFNMLISHCTNMVQIIDVKHVTILMLSITLK